MMHLGFAMRVQLTVKYGVLLILFMVPYVVKVENVYHFLFKSAQLKNKYFCVNKKKIQP